MDLSVEAATREWGRRVEEFARATGREDGEVLREQVRLVASGMVKLTPPFKSLSQAESFGEQRRLGLAAVEGQVRAAFVPLSGVAEKLRSESLRSGLAAAMERGSDSGVRAILAAAKLPAQNLVSAPTAALHNAVRNSQGRVRRRGLAWVVMGPERAAGAAIARFVREKQKLVGKAKGGWMALVDAVQARGIPGWVRGQAQRGAVDDRLRQERNPQLVARNTVSYVARLDASARFVRIALRNAGARLERQLLAKKLGRWKRTVDRRAA